jgi:chromosome partitioning protein
MDPQANASLHIGKVHPSRVDLTCAELLLSGAAILPSANHEETNIEGVSLITGRWLLGKPKTF